MIPHQSSSREILVYRLLGLYAKLQSEGWYVDANTIFFAVEELNGAPLTEAQERFLEERLKIWETSPPKK